MEEDKTSSPQKVKGNNDEEECFLVDVPLVDQIIDKSTPPTTNKSDDHLTTTTVVATKKEAIKHVSSFQSAKEQLEEEEPPPPPPSPTVSTPRSPNHQHHKKTKSNTDISLGSRSSHRKPRSQIGAVYRLSGKGGKISIRPIDSPSAAAAGAPPDLSPTDHQVPPLPAGGATNKDGNETDDDPLVDQAASWADVYRACCVHSIQGWTQIGTFISLLLLLLYFFLVGLDLLGTSFKVVGGCTAGSLLGSDTSPLASVMIGIIATTLLQSSSTTTAIIVSLVSGGLDVQQGIYMIMGANIGTSVTAMLVSLAHMGGDGEELERAFGGSSVLFIFNFMTVLILFPLEVTTKYLNKLTRPMLPAEVGGGESWEGPIKKMVNPLVKKIIIANKDLIDGISTGEVESCNQVYPVHCTNNNDKSYESCQEGTMVGVIACDSQTGKCPAFFQDGATKNDDMVSGWVCLVVALTVLIFCLIGLVTLLRKMLLGASTRIIYKATNINPILAMIIGCGVTVMVQSSSITTSVLVPLAGIGVLNLENMYPLVLGADIGTTFTALMAALVSSKVESLQIALVHLFFNVTGILIWYPIPFLRNGVILKMASLIGKATKQWNGFPLLFIVMVFFLLPLLLVGISSCFEVHKTGFTALGTFIVLVIVLMIIYFLLWWNFRNGKSKFQEWIQLRERRAAAIQALADDLDYLKVDTEWCKNEIYRIKDFASHVRVMEEGRPVSTVQVPITTTMAGGDEAEEGEEEMFGFEDDERLSTFESCRSRPWKDILYMGAGSIRSELY